MKRQKLMSCELDTMIYARRQITFVVGDHDQSLVVPMAECLYNVLDQSAISVVKAVQGFVKYQKLRVLYKCPR